MLEVTPGIFGRHSIAEECFRVIEELLPKNKIVLELGSGRTTKILTELWTVYSVEHNSRWAYNAPNSTYIRANLVNGWYDVKVLKEKLPKEYDLLLIDGPPGDDRKHFFDHIDLFKTDIIWIIDDAVRESKLVKNIEKYLNRKAELHLEPGKGKAFAVILP